MTEVGTFWTTQLWTVPRRRFALEVKRRGKWGGEFLTHA